ncbi:MAG: hypothetical protein ABH884_04365 [Candidatus Komeilibacteria bacterium]
MLFFHNIAPNDGHLEQIKERVKEWNQKLPFYLTIRFKQNGNGSQIPNMVGRIEDAIRIEKDQFLIITFIQDHIVDGSTITADRHEQTITIDCIQDFWPTSKEDAERRIHKTTNL